MPREQISDDTKIDQPSDLTLVLDRLVSALDRKPEVIEADTSVMSKEYLDELAFMAEWVTIRLEPSGAENEATTFSPSVNGEDPEVLVDGRVRRLKHLPVGIEMTIRRSVVEVIARSKTMRVFTDHNADELHQQIINTRRAPRRPVSQTQPFTIISDPSPRGSAWRQEMIRRQFVFLLSVGSGMALYFVS